MDRTRLQRRALQLTFKRTRDPWDNTGQAPSARYWKASRREERASGKLKRKDGVKKKDTEDI
jgi:hypothetical protein